VLASFLVQEETQREHVSMSSCTCNACAVQAYNGSRPTTRVTEQRRETPAVGQRIGTAPLRLCAPAGGLRRTTFLSDTMWMVRASDGGASGGGGGGRGGGGLTVLRRSEAEALQPQNGEGRGRHCIGLQPPLHAAALASG